MRYGIFIVHLHNDCRPHTSPPAAGRGGGEGGESETILPENEYTFVSGGCDNIKVWKCPEGNFLRNISLYNIFICLMKN